VKLLAANKRGRKGPLLRDARGREVWQSYCLESPFATISTYESKLHVNGRSAVPYHFEDAEIFLILQQRDLIALQTRTQSNVRGNRFPSRRFWEAHFRLNRRFQVPKQNNSTPSSATTQLLSSTHTPAPAPQYDQIYIFKLSKLIRPWL
jgi:hypothetical protein